MVSLADRDPVNSLDRLRTLLADSGGQQYYKELRALRVDPARVSRSLAEHCGSRVKVWLSVCVNCGLCAQSCPFYLARRDPHYIPAYKARTLAHLLCSQGRVSSRFMIRAMDTAWGRCSCCNRCGVHCPMGIDSGVILNVLRTVLFEQGFVPWEMKIGSGMHRVFGAQMDVSNEEWLDTCIWLEEEHPGLHIPVDRSGSRTLYILNAREVKHYPQDIAASALLFQLAGEDWSVTSHGWDSTSLSMFAGDREGCAQNVRRVYSAVETLRPGRVVGTECGHAYRATVVEGPYWDGRQDGKTPVPFLHYVEWLAEALREERLKLDPARRIKEPVTIQDPCNIVRNGGLGRALREVVHAIAEDVREMPESGEHAFCCGGGGGLNGIGRYRASRNTAFEAKVRHIRATGAKLVIVSCHNCGDAMRDMLYLYDVRGVRHSLLKPLVLKCLERGDGVENPYDGIE